MEHISYEVRFGSHPSDAKKYDTQELREAFLIEKIFEKDKISMVYTDYDRIIVGGVYPVSKNLTLESIDPLKSEYFLERREIGIINIGDTAKIIVDNQEVILGYKEALYIGRGTKNVLFGSIDANKPAKLYFNSAPAHKTYPTKKITLKDAIVANMGSADSANERKINKLIVNGVVDTCQLQMGMTEFKNGSVWNTMPANTHGRRMEAYFYFEVPEDQAICHFMGDPKETRHIFMHNEQAVISPTWSIHAGVGTAKYTFIWGMGGENLDYSDMDIHKPSELR